MNETPTITDMMAAYALDAVGVAQKNFQAQLDSTEGSVAVVEQILAKCHDSLPRGFFQKLFKSPPPPDTFDQVCKIFWAYVGEIIRRHHGGEWEFDEQSSPGMRVISLRNGDRRIWPAMKVRKRIVNGAEDNVWHYFRMVTAEWNPPVGSES